MFLPFQPNYIYFPSRIRDNYCCTLTSVFCTCLVYSHIPVCLLYFPYLRVKMQRSPFSLTVGPTAVMYRVTQKTGTFEMRSGSHVQLAALRNRDLELQTTSPFSNHGSVERSTACFRHKNVLQKQLYSLEGAQKGFRRFFST